MISQKGYNPNVRTHADRYFELTCYSTPSAPRSSQCYSHPQPSPIEVHINMYIQERKRDVLLDRCPLSSKFVLSPHLADGPIQVQGSRLPESTHNICLLHRCEGPVGETGQSRRQSKILQKSTPDRELSPRPCLNRGTSIEVS